VFATPHLELRPQRRYQQLVTEQELNTGRRRRTAGFTRCQYWRKQYSGHLTVL
jgi:hypothetical protein